MSKLFKMNFSLYLGVFCVSVLLFLCFFGPLMAPHTLTEMLETQYRDGKVLSPPMEPFESDEYPLGTDKWGYDLSTMILHGLRYTVFIALAITVIKMGIGTLCGLYIGTWRKTPSWIIAFENAWSYVPLFLVLYFFLRPISFNSPLETSTLLGYFIVIAAIISIPSIISSVRLKTAELHKSVYIEAAMALGAGRSRLIWKHIFPQMKETLLVMFLLEIVYVITIMGQLALVNIFIGGTTVRFDPLIYLSVTKELSGIVGQARLNIYGNTHILIIPLIVLLFTTISFSLLANGLKNRYQSNYARTPWIKIGQMPNMKPIRKKFGEKQAWWPLSGEKLALLSLIIAFIGAGTYVYVTKDADVGVKSDAQATYDLQFVMDEKGVFDTVAAIEVKNQSKDDWEELVFYFIPNVFKEGHPFASVKGHSEVEMKAIEINGEKAEYSLEEDTLRIILPPNMKDKHKHRVEVSYTFTPPEEGVRFSKENENYYLAQWYPMAATYQDGKWNKEDYSDGGETYHTDFSDYRVQYKLPEGYSFVSTAEKDPALLKSEGTVKINKVRDFFIAIIKDMEVHEMKANNGVNIRLFTKKDHNKGIEDTLELAQDALRFYQEKIGEYPHKQLDMILDHGAFMEYPGIVTINPYIQDTYFYRNAIVHEIAHQYFYGVVSNDPYHQAWIDEGITEFATSMYFYAGRNQSEGQAFSIPNRRMEMVNELGLGRQYSNVPLHELKSSAFIYGQPAMELLKMMKDKYQLKGEDVKIVSMQFLSDYYHHFQYKEVNTDEFIRFAKDYFLVPSGYFNSWLNR
ncbi:ABC-type dipeptide/oligopeptide/nickel transport system permease subunit [Cytobacillus eiseniae]|uniref:ABC-type dipeptide/oligopeptide/nickel transport system permease subunit n=1 Tax=Cytobacillus eiseniae TaxID=762947 RepID=A0ABS4RG02_9BACI|nr:ABC transporter permease subunit [Cytobacillus eiseniae]MBP2241331.1 ABC-type dipeptide/oligopeptide/nickel transport system permease subunit [Cytobacillus eiseniae]